MPDERDPQEVAEETSEEIQPSNPYVEPPNSTVDDWFGQRVQRDADRAEAGDQSHATGEQQAEENASNDPPA